MADVATRLLNRKTAKVQALSLAYDQAKVAQEKFRKSTGLLNRRLRKSNEEVTNATKRVGHLRTAYDKVTGSIKKYGIEISGAAAGMQLFRIEQRDIARGIKHYYKTTDKLPQQLNKTGDAFENAGKTGRHAMKSLGTSVNNLVHGEFRKAYSDVDKLTGGKGSLYDTFLGTEGSMGALNNARNLAIATGKDAHKLAQKWNYPVESVRDFQDQLIDTMRFGTESSEKYAKTLDNVADRMMYVKKVIPGIEEGEMTQFLNKSMWEFGVSSGTAAKQLTNLNQYVEISNDLLQKEGKLAKGATAQWKDDYAKAVMEAAMSSKSLFLNTEKLAESMMGASHAAQEMGLSYAQTQRVMKGIPTVLSSVPTFMKDQIGGSFLAMTKDADKYQAWLKTIPEKQRGAIAASIKNIKESGANPLAMKEAMFDVASGTAEGQAMILKKMFKAGGKSANPSLMKTWTGMSSMDVINLKASLAKGDDAFLEAVKKKRKEGGFEKDFQNQAKTGSLGVLTSMEDLLGKATSYLKEISENRTLLTGAGLFGGGKGLMNLLGIRSSGVGVSAAGGGAALTAGGSAAGGGTALTAGGGTALTAGGGILASTLGTFLSGGVTGGSFALHAALSGGKVPGGWGMLARLLGQGGTSAAGGTTAGSAMSTLGAVAAPLATVYASSEIAKYIENTDKSWGEMASDIEKAEKSQQTLEKKAAILNKENDRGIFSKAWEYLTTGKITTKENILLTSSSIDKKERDTAKERYEKNMKKLRDLDRKRELREKARLDKKVREKQFVKDSAYQAIKMAQSGASYSDIRKALPEITQKSMKDNMEAIKKTGKGTLSPDIFQNQKKSMTKLPPSSFQSAFNALRHPQALVSQARSAIQGRKAQLNDLPLKAGVDNMGKLTLTLDSFYDLLTNYEAAKNNNLPFGTGVPR